TLYTKPWKVKDPKSPSHVGIGAFNLVRAAAYRAAGGHPAIAMRPDDDLKLGKLLKKKGFHQEFVFGLGALRVEWYASVRELIQGLMKNAFSGVAYRAWVVAVTTGVQPTAWSGPSWRSSSPRERRAGSTWPACWCCSVSAGSTPRWPACA